MASVPVAPSRRRATLERADVVAAALVLLIGGPLVYLFASAFVDGETRRHEAPLRALFGSSIYDQLVHGEPIPQHYLGNDRLAPDFTLTDQHGQPWSLHDHRGHVVVMNFWTTTCGPCVEEMPTLVDLARIAEDRGDFELVTVSVDRSFDTVRTVVPDDAGLVVLLDADRHITRDVYGTRLFPETWIIDPRGVIRARVDAARDWASGISLDAIRSFM
ncbi:MAG: TlpA disulfide reductase family protein [Sandaracinus sp.]